MVPVDDYELIDVGAGARLERFGEHVTDRPHGGVLTDRRDAGRWADADIRFDRDGGWSGPGLATAAGGWSVGIAGLTMELRPTDAGQVGVFPEHADRIAWLAERVSRRLAASTDATDGSPVEVLNLFAYTGLVTLALARAGARVTHVDAARPSVGWARRNATRNGLDDHPIRWIVDDARAYAGREARRGRRYDGIVLDPPTYGHGVGGSAPWSLDADLPDLLRTLAGLLAPDGFVLLTAHTEDYPSDRLLEVASEAIGTDRLDRATADADRLAQARTITGDLRLEATSGATLDLGAYAGIDLGAV